MLLGLLPGGKAHSLLSGLHLIVTDKYLNLASSLYQHQQLKRVYYSGYIPINNHDSRLPAIVQPPLVREHRLYQSDWLLRFYDFRVDEIVNDKYPDLDLDIDPKLAYALRNPWVFPIDINKAPYEMILRIPGVGVNSAKMIVMSRKYGKINSLQLQKMGVVMKRAKYFITCNELASPTVNELTPDRLKVILTEKINEKS